ncbi:MAG: hypothetical protein K2M76_07885 [Muribaculaceae bacterium]|nr:hypothetical protein [Muribaculaceae bacterium]
MNIDGAAGDSTFTTAYSLDYGDEAVVRSKQSRFGLPPGLRLIWNGSADPGAETRSRWECVCGALGVGFNGATGGVLPYQMGKSFELQWLYVLGAQYKLNKASNLTIGVGIDWRNWRYTRGDMCIVPADGGTVAIGHYEEGAHSYGSRIKIFSLTVPLLYQVKLPVKVPNGHAALALGPILNINTHGSVKTWWTDPAGNEKSVSSVNIGQRFVTVDFLAALKFCGWASVYFKYSPQTLLDAPGPKFRGYSTGIMCSF